MTAEDKQGETPWDKLEKFIDDEVSPCEYCEHDPKDLDGPCRGTPSRLCNFYVENTLRLRAIENDSDHSDETTVCMNCGKNLDGIIESHKNFDMPIGYIFFSPGSPTTRNQPGEPDEVHMICSDCIEDFPSVARGD